MQVPTRLLVPQQAELFSKYVATQIGQYTGDRGVDLWSPEKWRDEIRCAAILRITLNNMAHPAAKICMPIPIKAYPRERLCFVVEFWLLVGLGLLIDISYTGLKTPLPSQRVERCTVTIEFSS